MKTSTHKINIGTTVAKSCVAAIVFLANGNCNSQVQNNGLIHIAGSSSMLLTQGTYSFGAAPALTITDRTATHGVLSFASSASWSNATNTHYADGYVRRYGAARFVFPIGNAGIYAPLEAVATDATGLDAAYFRNDPATIGTAIDPTILGISANEYWSLKSVAGAQAKFTLTWRNTSDIAALTNSNLNKLTIAGWNGLNWVEIPSRTDAVSILGSNSSLDSGSITTISNIDLATFTAFALANRSNVDCSPAVSVNSSRYWTTNGWATTPSGTTAATPPTPSTTVFLVTDYQGPSFTCGGLSMSGGFNLTVGNGVTVEVLGAFSRSGAGRLIIKDGGSFIRRSAASFPASIEVEKTTRNMRMNDYIYWGSPVTADANAAINAATATAPGSLPGAFDLKYSYASGTGGGWVPLGGTARGRGFITRVKNQAPFTQQGVLGGSINVVFSGTENNGDVTVPVVNNPASPNGATSYNLVSNPYPSPIDLDKFLIENLDIDGAAYLWTSATDGGNSNNTNTQYTAADYAVYNLAGQVNTSPISQQINGKIAIAQGFKVKSLVNSGSVTFNNCMRVGASGANFFRQASSVQSDKDSYKLNIAAEGIYSEILIAYMPQATLGYDRLYDAGRNSTSPVKLYSILEDGAMKLAINSRPEFTDTDAVALGLSKTGTAAETFKINISEKSGIFSQGAPVYLHDKALNRYHDFAAGEYVFTSNEVASDNRFEVVYKNAALNNPDFEMANVFASLKAGQVEVSASIGIDAIDVYDLAGRRVVSFKGEGQKRIAKAFTYSEGIYIAKIKLENGAIVTEKLIGIK